MLTVGLLSFSFVGWIWLGEKLMARASGGEVARIRKKRNLTRIFFFGSIGFMALSCLGGCGLAMLISNDTAKAVFGITGLLGPFVGLGGMILMWSDRSRYDRSLDLAREAEELDLDYREQPTKKQLAEVDGLQVFHDHTDDFARNCLDGEYKKTPLLVMDYNCSWGRGKSAYVIMQTVIVFPDALPDVPDLLLYPRGLLDKLADAVGLGGRPIPIPGEKEMNKEYGLYSEREKKAAELFTPEVADACLDERKIVLEVNRGTMLVYWYETYIKPAELEDRLATAMRLKKLLGRGA
jgi:hypothetical protein